MRWKDMRETWPTVEAYAKDHTPLDMALSRAVFLTAVASVACLAGAVIGVTWWSWFFWSAGCLLLSFGASVALLTYRKVR